MDDRYHGFPFDRDIDFDFSKLEGRFVLKVHNQVTWNFEHVLRSFAQTTVTIVHRDDSTTSTTDSTSTTTIGDIDTDNVGNNKTFVMSL